VEKMEEVVEVNKHDEFIRWVSRKEVHENKLIHRSIQIVVINSNQELLIQLRHRDKQTYPHYWDVSCSGHVDRVDHPNDDPSQGRFASDIAAVRELEEELGVTSTIDFVCDIPPIEGVNYEYSRLYITTWDGPIKIQESELEQVAWVDVSKSIGYHPTTLFLQWIVEHRSLWMKK
jgi:isopentenyldiphosphate isomerase